MPSCIDGVERATSVWCHTGGLVGDAGHLSRRPDPRWTHGLGPRPGNASAFPEATFLCCMSAFQAPSTMPFMRTTERLRLGRIIAGRGAVAHSRDFGPGEEL